MADPRSLRDCRDPTHTQAVQQPCAGRQARQLAPSLWGAKRLAREQCRSRGDTDLHEAHPDGESGDRRHEQASQLPQREESRQSHDRPEAAEKGDGQGERQVNRVADEMTQPIEHRPLQLPEPLAEVCRRSRRNRPARFTRREHVGVAATVQQLDPQQGGYRRVEERVLDTDRLPGQSALAVVRLAHEPGPRTLGDGSLADDPARFRQHRGWNRTGRDGPRDAPLREETVRLLLLDLERHGRDAVCQGDRSPQRDADHRTDDGKACQDASQGRAQGAPADSPPRSDASERPSTTI